jgi:hypothetical protein
MGTRLASSGLYVETNRLGFFVMATSSAKNPRGAASIPYDGALALGVLGQHCISKNTAALS